MTVGQAAARTDWPLVWLLVLGGVVAAAQIGKAPPAIPILRTELGLTLSTASWVLSGFNLIGALTGIAMGALADRFGHRNVIVAGLVLTAAASAVGSAAGGTAVLLTTRFVEGLGFMAAVVAVPALLVRVVRPCDQGVVFGIWGGYMPAGTAIMIALAPIFLSFSGWRGMWLVNAGMLLACAALVWLGARPASRHAGRSDAPPMLAGITRTVTSKGPLLLGGSFALYTSIFLTVFGFLPTLLIDELGFSLGIAAGWTAFAVASNIGGNLIGGLGLQWGVPRWVLITLAFLVMGAGVLVVYQGGLPAAARLTAAVAVSLVGGIIPAVCIAGSAVHAPTPALVGTTNGLIMQASQLGQTIGPVATAALVTAAGGWQVAPALLMLSAGVGIVLAQAVRRVERVK